MKCKYTKPDGTKCGGYAMVGKDFCWAHSPEINKTMRQEAYSRGGKANSHFEPGVMTPGLLPVTLNSSSDIPQMLINAIKGLHQGTMHVRIGTAIGYLSYILLKSYEIADFEPRLKALEEKVKDKEYKEFVYGDEK